MNSCTKNNPSSIFNSTLKVKVIPGASKAMISGWLGDSLKVKVSQPPEKGKANAAVEAIICDALNMPVGTAKIVSGSTSQHKVVQIDGLSQNEVHQRLSGPSI